MNCTDNYALGLLLDCFVKFFLFIDEYKPLSNRQQITVVNNNSQITGIWADKIVNII